MSWPGRRFALALLAGGAVLASGPDLAAQTSLSGERLHVVRLPRAVTIDGRLDEGEWSETTRVDTWYETSPGDNIEPAVRNVGYIAFDDRFFYAAFEFDDPNPSAIRAPYADHDRISGNATDYGGVILDTRNDGHSAVLLLTSASGVQDDAVTDDDGAGEDSSPDFFWDSAARITERGWTLELRVPFSSLRYRDVDPQTWGIFLYRNHPRGFRHMYFTARLPRGGNCFICRTNSLSGLSKLPSGGHFVLAPYASASQTAQPTGSLGTALDNDPVDANVGLDLKWTPDADNAVDFTLNPDFSQVEADTAQIAANERFALSFPEKRPFFLEGVELFSTPLRAVYTRAITAPRWGARGTGKLRGVGYTVLVADDEGGGSVILPGPNGSSTAPQVFSSTVLVGRAKRSFGRSAVSVLTTGREGRDGGGSNWLAGPDVQWRPSTADVITGQWLVSRTETPRRPDLSPEWTGETLSGGAAHVQWARSTTHLNANATYRDLANGFRAEAGFIPQVGYRETSGGVAWTVRPTKILADQRTFANLSRQIDQAGALISRTANVGVNMETGLNGFVQVQYNDDQLRSGEAVFPAKSLSYFTRVSPNRWLALVSVDGSIGEAVDFANSRPGHGGTVNVTAQLQPTNHLELTVVDNTRWLDVDADDQRRRLFTARVSRLRGTYTFTAKSFVRVIAQYVSTRSDPSLYTGGVRSHLGTFLGSFLFAYKLNWQSVLFVGYGDDRELSSEERLERSGRQFFVKVSYALQR